MIIKQGTVRKNSDDIALLYVNIPIRNVWISMMKINMTACPKPVVAPKKFQYIHKPLVVFCFFKQCPVSCIMKGIYKKYNHGDSAKNIK